MPKRVPFALKLLDRLDRVDRDSVQSCVLGLARENAVYEEILQDLKEGVLIVTREGRIRFANRQASTWLGVESFRRDQTFLRDAVHDSGLARFLEKNIDALKERRVDDLEILAPREMHLRIFMTPLESSSDEEILITLMPVAEEKNSPFDEKWARVKALVSLAAGIAHEIGNPLNAIGIHLQLLKKELRTLPENKRGTLEKTLDVLNAETSRLDKIIRNFLKATRRPPLRFRSEDLNAVVEECLEFMRPELETSKVRIQVHPDRTLPFFLMDRERLAQAFMNLIKNAMEAMPKGGCLSVRISHQKNVALLHFKDEGSGIPEKDLPHIFEAYFTTKEEGSGLGLVTVFQAVREHGGRIEVSSKVGKGTTFTLLLPVRQPKLQLPEYHPKK